jgi:NADPH:quinone reductase-like Zn-dependent oxidoreductase
VVYGGLFPDKGAFGEYLKVPTDPAWRPPFRMSHQQAAAYELSAVTAMQTLYTNFDIP